MATTITLLRTSRDNNHQQGTIYSLPVCWIISVPLLLLYCYFKSITQYILIIFSTLLQPLQPMGMNISSAGDGPSSAPPLLLTDSSGLSSGRSFACYGLMCTTALLHSESLESLWGHPSLLPLYFWEKAHLGHPCWLQINSLPQPLACWDYN